MRRFRWIVWFTVFVLAAIAFVIGPRVPKALRQQRAVAAIEAKDGHVLFSEGINLFGWDIKCLHHDGIFGHCFSDVDQLSFDAGKYAEKRINDLDLKELRCALGDLRGLRVLYFSHTEISNQGLQQLVGLKEIEVLSLAGTRIDDSGLVSLSTLPKLEVLNLSDTQVTDAGLEGITYDALPELCNVYLDGARVTEEGVQKFSMRFGGGLKVFWNGRLFRDGKSEVFPGKQ